jgi:DNA-binding NtrC family response regulator
MDHNKPLIHDRLKELVDEMIGLGIRYVDAKDEFEKIFITGVLSSNGFNRSEASEKLGIHRNTLIYKIRRHKIEATKKNS